MLVKLTYKPYGAPDVRTESYSIADIRATNTSLLLHLANGEYRTLYHEQIIECIITD